MQLKQKRNKTNIVNHTYKRIQTNEIFKKINCILPHNGYYIQGLKYTCKYILKYKIKIYM